MRHHEYNYLFIWFSFRFRFQNRCGVHNSWLTASCQRYVLCSRIVRANVVPALHWHWLLHHSIRLWRWKHSRISIMSLFSKGEIRLANACRVRSISIPITAFPLRCVCVASPFDRSSHTIPPLIRWILFLNIRFNSCVCKRQMQIANEFTFQCVGKRQLKWLATAMNWIFCLISSQSKRQSGEVMEFFFLYILEKQDATVTKPHLPQFSRCHRRRRPFVPCSTMCFPSRFNAIPDYYYNCSF